MPKKKKRKQRAYLLNNTPPQPPPIRLIVVCGYGRHHPMIGVGMCRRDENVRLRLDDREPNIHNSCSIATLYYLTLVLNKPLTSMVAATETCTKVSVRLGR